MLLIQLIYANFQEMRMYNKDNVIKKETLAQVFSYEFCKIFKNIFFNRTPSVAASVITVQFEPK